MQALLSGVLMSGTSITDAFSKKIRARSGKSTKECKPPMRPKVISSYSRPPGEATLSCFQGKNHTQRDLLASLAPERRDSWFRRDESRVPAQKSRALENKQWSYEVDHSGGSRRRLATSWDACFLLWLASWEQWNRDDALTHDRRVPGYFQKTESDMTPAWTS